MNGQGFLLIKNYNFSKISDIKFESISGYAFKPRNNINYNGIMVSKLIMINPSFTETILKKKIRHRLEIYLRFIISIIDEEDDDTSISDLRAALNDLTRYKSIVQNKYLAYLDKRYAEMLLKKISLLEEELKNKIVYFNPKEKEEPKKSR